MDYTFGYMTNHIPISKQNKVRYILLNIFLDDITNIIYNLWNDDGELISYLCDCGLYMHPFEMKCLLCVARQDYGIYFDGYIQKCALRTIAFCLELGNIPVYPPQGQNIFKYIGPKRYVTQWYRFPCYGWDDNLNLSDINRLPDIYCDINRNKQVFMNNVDRYDRFIDRVNINLNLEVYDYNFDFQFTTNPETSLILAYDISEYERLQLVCQRGLHFKSLPGHTRQLTTRSHKLKEFKFDDYHHGDIHSEDINSDYSD